MSIVCSSVAPVGAAASRPATAWLIRVVWLPRSHGARSHPAGTWAIVWVLVEYFPHMFPPLLLSSSPRSADAFIGEHPTPLGYLILRVESVSGHATPCSCFPQAWEGQCGVHVLETMQTAALLHPARGLKRYAAVPGKYSPLRKDRTSGGRLLDRFSSPRIADSVFEWARARLRPGC